MKFNFACLQLGHRFAVSAWQLIRQLWFICFMSLGLTWASVVFAEETNKLNQDSAIEIEKIECEGNKNANCDFIIKQANLQEKETVNDDRLNDAKVRLKLVGYFQDADIRLKKGSAPGKAIVTIRVVERSKYSYKVSAGLVPLSSATAGIADVTGTNNNLTGNGDSLSLRYRGYVQHYKGDLLNFFQHTARIEYVRPHLIFPRMYLMTGIDATYSKYDGAGYFNKVYRGNFILGYKVFDYSFFNAGYRRYISSDNPLQDFFLQYGWNSQDDDNFPTQGSRFIVGLDYYLWRSKYWPSWKTKFIELQASYLQHFGIGDGHVLSFRVSAFRDFETEFYIPEDRATSIRYSRILKRSDGNNLKRTALYIEPGLFNGFYNLGSQKLWGAKAGTTIETKHGLVNLFLIGGVQR